MQYVAELAKLAPGVFEPRKGRHNRSPQRKLGVLIRQDSAPPLQGLCIRALGANTKALKTVKGTR